MKQFTKDECVVHLDNALDQLARVRNHIQYTGPGYNSKADKKTRRIERLIAKLVTIIQKL